MHIWRHHKYGAARQQNRPFCGLLH
jgi:hypothetical protein